MSTITTRAGKGSPLTNTELDANFTNLNTDKLELGQAQSTGTASGILYLNGSKVVTTGSALTFDGTNLGVNSTILAARTLSVKGRAAFTATANDSQLAIYSDGVTNGLYSTYNSTGSYLPMTFYINDVEQMRLTSTGLGIGTSSPSGTLHLSTASGNTNIYHNVTGTGTAARTTYTRANTVKFYAGLGAWSGGDTYEIAGTSGALTTLDSSGNLGLGVTPSAWNSAYKALQVNGGPLFSIFSSSASSGSYGGIASNTYLNTSGSWTYINSQVATRYDQYAGQHQWYTAPSGTAGNAITFTQAMTLDASGNLGIGTSSPGVNLDIYKASSDVNIRALSGTSEMRMLSANGGYGVIGSYSNMPVIFATNAAERMRIDSSGNVGIGTSSPVSRLTYSGDFNAGTVGSKPSLTGAGSYGGGIGFLDGANTAGIYTQGAGTELRFFTGMAATDTAASKVKMTIDASGNVGIGTSSPSYRLAVAAGAGEWRFDPSILAVGGNSGAYGTTYVGGVPSAHTTASGGAKMFLGGEGRGDGLVSSVAFFRNNTESMRIDSSGNVGIGTSSPTARLHISGGTTAALYVAGGAGSTIRNAASSGSSWFVGTNVDSYILHNESNTPMLFTTNGTERMRIDSSGNVGIGTSTPYNATTDRLTVLKNQNAYAQLVIDNQNSGASAGASLSLSAYGGGATFVVPSATPGTNPLLINVNGSERMRIDSSGNVGIGTSSPGYKLDVYSAGSASSEVALRLVNPYTSGTNVASASLLFGYHSGGNYRSSGKIESGQYTNGSFASGFLAFYTQYSELIPTSPQMYIDTFGNVGIGTNTPEQKLQVNGNAVIGTTGSTGTVLRMGPDSSNGFVIRAERSDASGTRYLAFGLDYNERMRIDASGKLLVGLSASKYYGASGIQAIKALSVFGAHSTDTAIIGAYNYNSLDSTPTWASVCMNQHAPSETGNLDYCAGVAKANTSEILAVNTSALVITANTQTPIVFGNGGVERMRIEPTGNVYIGTAAAAGNTLRYLDIQNYSPGNANSGSIIRLITANAAATAATTVDLVKYANGSFVISNNEPTSGANIVFNNAGSERMRIDSSGRVGVGTTSPFHNLQVAGSFGTSANYLVSGSNLGSGYFTSVVDPNNSSNWLWNIKLDQAFNMSVGGVIEWTIAHNTNAGGSGYYRRHAQGRVTVSTQWNGSTYTPEIITDSVIFNDTGASFNAVIYCNGTAGTVAGEYENTMNATQTGGQHLLWSSSPIYLRIRMTGGFNATYPGAKTMTVVVKGAE